MQEAQILGSLHGTGVGPKLINYAARGPQQQVDKLAMSLAKGSPLQRKLERGMSLVEEQQAASSFVTKLSRMHKKGIVHNDLHTDNIVVGDDGDVTLIDFGKAEQDWGRAYLEAVRPMRVDQVYNFGRGRYEMQGLDVPMQMEEKLKENRLMHSD